MADINGIAEQIQGLTLLEASQLVKLLEEKLGVSAAAAVVGSLKIAHGLTLRREQEAVMVTILCDSGEKYLSERFWHE